MLYGMLKNFYTDMMDVLPILGIGAVFIGLFYRNHLNIKNSKIICNDWKQNKIIDDFLNSSDELDFLTTISNKHYFKHSFHTKYLAELLNIPVNILDEHKYTLAIKRYYSIKAKERELTLYEEFKKEQKIISENKRLC